ncbi:MAG: class I SAM-dependent methyltransferase [Deltaproteobacteria bacterium]|nr:class I SAM-dependent methyltransferase [Deltaproteobacteria bacterium]
MTQFVDNGLNQNRNLECADIFAPDYDREVPANGWCAPEIIFNLMTDYILRGDTLLDIGIGTGLSALPFKEAGLAVYGIDGSAEMLKICSAKMNAIELELRDLSRDCLPYEDSFFNHVISTGVLHLLGDLNRLFDDVSRILKTGGVFGFTVDEQIKEADKPGNVLCDGGIFEYTNPKSGIKSYKHSREYIADLLDINNLTVLESQTFHAFKKTEWSGDVFFGAYIARKH